nr:hypothetical protein [uncultured Mucilaginibacter sp.]
MNKKHKLFLPAMAFVVLSVLQISAISAFAQGPGPGGPGAGGPGGPGGFGRGAALPPIPLAGDTSHSITRFFTPSTPIKKAPDAKGFIQRWLVLEPVKKSDKGNSQMSEGYLRESFAANNFSPDFNAIPKNGETITIGKQDLKWRALDSREFNFNLYHLSYATNTTRNGVLYWLVTVINCTEEIKNVRLSAGPNSAGMFWVNGKDVLVVPGDKDVIADLATSPLLTLKKGKNIVRAGIMNGQGMANFCLRFLDANGAPVKNFTTTYE